jgi:hypothetical protein
MVILAVCVISFQGSKLMKWTIRVSRSIRVSFPAMEILAVTYHRT